MADGSGPLQDQHSAFPHSLSAFESDPRVSYSKLDEKYILESDEGEEYEWDTALWKWIPVVGIALFCI